MDDENINVENQELDGEIVYNEPPSDLVEDNLEPEATEEYQPNLSYKIKDEEHEFDEMFNPFVTNKESEDALRDLYTRAGGLDSYKEKTSAYEERLEKQDGELSGLREGFGTLRDLRDEGNYRRLFQSLGVDDETVMKYAIGVAQEQDMPEDQRRIIQENREYKDRLHVMESNASKQASTAMEQATQRDLGELDTYINANKELDTKMSGAGISLSDEIIAYGISANKVTGSDPSIAEATQAVVSKYNKLMNLFDTPAQPENRIQQRITNRPDTLPTVRSTNQTAPTETFSSIDQLRKLSATFA